MIRRLAQRLPSRRRLAFYVASYVLVWGAFFSFLWIGEAHDRELGDDLASHGVVILASVTSSDPGNHNSICFTYTVAAKPYSGCGRADFDKDASQLPPGSQTHVTYDSRNPSLYCSCTAESLQNNGYVAPIVGAFWLGTFIWLGLVAVRHTLVRPPARPVAPLRNLPAVSQEFHAGRRTWRQPGLPRWLWDGGVVSYDLALAASEASTRIAQSIRPEGLFDSLVAPGKLRGWVQGSRFRLTAHLPLISSSFNSILDGQLEDVVGGSRLVGRFRMRGFVVAFMAIWLALATVIGLLITITSLADPKSWSPGPPPFFFGLVFPVFGIGLLTVGRLIARVQETTILKRLDELLGVEQR